MRFGPFSSQFRAGKAQPAVIEHRKGPYAAE
jgi:hypothetical protein